MNVRTKGKGTFYSILQFCSILRKRTLLWKVVLKSIVILAIVIYEVVFPNPFEPPSLCPC